MTAIQGGVTRPAPYSIFNPPEYERMRFRCEVDYAVVSVTLNRPSNFNTVRKKTNATYAHPLDEGLGRAATKFEIRLEDPTSRSHMLRRLTLLREHADGFSTEPRLKRIEVAFDCYSRDADASALLAMTERFFRFGTEWCSDNMRLTRRKGEVVWAEDPVRFASRLRQGFTIVIGDSEAQVMQRIYRKTTDKNGKVKLPAELHRARREVNLLGAGLDSSQKAFPSRDLADAAPWKFEALARWFRFRKLRRDAGLSPLHALVLHRQILLGIREPERAGRRLYNSDTQADTSLNELARDQLRELTRRFSSSKQ